MFFSFPICRNQVNYLVEYVLDNPLILQFTLIQCQISNSLGDVICHF